MSLYRGISRPTVRPEEIANIIVDIIVSMTIAAINFMAIAAIIFKIIAAIIIKIIAPIIFKVIAVISEASTNPSTSQYKTKSAATQFYSGEVLLIFLEYALTIVGTMTITIARGLLLVVYFPYKLLKSISVFLLFLVPALFQCILQILSHFASATVWLLSCAEYYFPLGITGLILFLLTLWVKNLLKANTEISEAQKILNCDLEKRKEELKFERQQHSVEIMKLKLESQEKDKLRTANLKLQSQLEKLQLKADEVDKLNVKTQGKKEKLKSQRDELILKLGKADKLHKVLETETLELKSKIQELKLELEREKDKRLCVICTDNNKSILLMPCKHFCLCKECLSHINSSECPLCREPIESAIDVYV